jgi:hypothetical protein
MNESFTMSLVTENGGGSGVSLRSPLLISQAAWSMDCAGVMTLFPMEVAVKRLGRWPPALVTLWIARTFNVSHSTISRLTPR